MINSILFLVFLACIGMTSAWIAENPGDLTIHWFGYRIDSSFAVLLLITLILAVALAYLYLLLRRMIAAPGTLSSSRRLKRMEKGLTALTQSVASLAAADTTEAEKHTQRAQKFLGQTPLTLLLSAQVARTRGDDAYTQQLLVRMLDHQETEYLAARSLSELARKQHRLDTALSLAQRAHALNPRGIAQITSLHLRLGQWQQALAAVDQALRRGKIGRAGMHRYKGIIYLEQGKQLLASGHAQATWIAAKRSLKHLPRFTPAIIFASQAYAAYGQRRQGLKLLIQAWKISPGSELGDALVTHLTAEPKEWQYKLATKLTTTHSSSNEGDIIAARLALAQRDWRQARKAAMAALGKRETARACRLMAEIERQERGDFEAANGWLTRSETSAADFGWVCHACGHRAPDWQSQCPSCDSFDTLEWK